MHTFEVWAPRARTLSIHIAGLLFPMQPAELGWWRATVEDAGPGTDYGFSIDGAEPVPDPRSAWQPNGIHGPSRIVDHAAFSWTDRQWQQRPLSSAIIYELHIGTFTPEGTFRGAVERLDYLIDLGITHIQLMPVNQFSGAWGWGYDGADLYAPHSEYGTPDDLKRLVDACHRKGLAVLLDVVYNHLGPAGNYLDRFGPYFTDNYRTPWGAAVNLDGPGSHEVRRFFSDNALMWLRDYHFDGLRLDAIHALCDRSAIHFLEHVSQEVDGLSSQLGKYFFLIAESDLNDPEIVLSREAGGWGMDAQWSDDFHHALHTLLTGERNGYYVDFDSYRDLAKALKHAFIYDHKYSPHRDRMHGRPVNGLSGHHFLAYAQTHDQVGNRAQGERFSHLLNIGRQKIAAALVLTSPFIPMLFQGEEFGSLSPFLYFTHHDDRELGEKVSAGRKSEFAAFGWDPDNVPDPQDPSTFQKSKLDWKDLEREPHSSLLAWTRELIELRNRSISLTDGRMDKVHVSYDEKAEWLVVRRGPIEVVCNLAPDKQAIPVSRMPLHALCSDEGWALRPGLIELPGDSVAVFTK